MTDEQIEELRRLEREATPAPWRLTPVLDFMGDAVLAMKIRNALPRLLDEREALLEALRDAADELDCLPTGDPQFARAAIAKAET